MFALASPEFLRYYDSTMQLLAARGHHVSVAVNWLRERKAARLDGLSGEESIEVLGLIPKRSDLWTPFARAVRGTFDFVRYLHPPLAAAPAVGARVKRKGLPPWLHALDRIPSVGDRTLQRLYGLMRRLEDAIPVSRRVTMFLEAHRPDVVIVSPLVDTASDQVDIVRAAQASGIPAGGAIASWAILIRPHPFNCAAWETADFSAFVPVSVWPRNRYTPAAEASRNSLYDSLSYSAAVVGVNTSAMVEAAILGRPVLSILASDFAATQEGTLHFHYLLPQNGGFLRVASSLSDHAAQLSEVMRTPEVTREQTARFVRGFIRPHGLARPCTPILADALERAAALSPTPVRDTAADRVTRVAVWPVAAALKVASLGERDGKGIWTRARGSLVRTARIAWKRLVVRPVLLAIWLARVVLGKARRGLWRAARAARTLPGRGVRVVRRARYHIGVRLHGDATAADSRETR